jgi:hypothetical protein
MAPWFSMPADKTAARVAILADLRQTLRALSCATRLLARRPPPARERAIIAAMRKAIRQAEASLSRFPSRRRP